MVENLTDMLKPIANWFNSLGTPEFIVHWGHPFFMAIVIFVMGSFVGLTGWRSRILLATDENAAIENKADHRKIAPLMYIFLASGYTGGILSLIMQNESIVESPHFWTGSIVLILLTVNALISGTGFIGNKAALRTVHAYLGSAALALMLIHAILGLRLGLSI